MQARVVQYTDWTNEREGDSRGPEETLDTYAFLSRRVYIEEFLADYEFEEEVHRLTAILVRELDVTARSLWDAYPDDMLLGELIQRVRGLGRRYSRRLARRRR